jgi:hypothetical protein
MPKSRWKQGFFGCLSLRSIPSNFQPGIENQKASFFPLFFQKSFELRHEGDVQKGQPLHHRLAVK